MKVNKQFTILVVTAIWRECADGYLRPYDPATSRVTVHARAEGEAMDRAALKVGKLFLGTARKVWYSDTRDTNRSYLADILHH